MDASQTTTTLANTTDNSDEEHLSKYMLLDRLFKFLDT